MREGMIIVMADENLKDHDLVKKATRDCNINHVFTSVYNGSQLTDLLLKRSVYKTDAEVFPDLVIMDISLPVINGFEILELREHYPQLTRIPFYILTATNSEESRLKALQLGAAGYFTKPLHFDELQTIVKGICKENFQASTDPTTK